MGMRTNRQGTNTINNNKCHTTTRILSHFTMDIIKHKNIFLFLFNLMTVSIWLHWRCEKKNNTVWEKDEKKQRKKSVLDATSDRDEIELNWYCATVRRNNPFGPIWETERERKTNQTTCSYFSCLLILYIFFFDVRHSTLSVQTQTQWRYEDIDCGAHETKDTHNYFFFWMKNKSVVSGCRKPSRWKPKNNIFFPFCFDHAWK